MITVVLIDEHRLIRTALTHCLSQTGEFQVVAEAGSALDGIRAVKQHQPSVVIMEMTIPDANAMSIVDEITRTAPQTKVIALTGVEDQDTMISALAAGVAGFVPKRGTLQDLIDAIRTVMAGASYMSPFLSQALFEYLQSQSQPAARGSAQHGLTSRETQVLRLIADGMTSKEVASVTGLSPETIRSYRKIIMQKLDVHNVAQLTQAVIRFRLVRKTATERSPAAERSEEPEMAAAL